MNSKRAYYCLLGLLVFSFVAGIAGAYFGNKYLQGKSVSLAKHKVERYQLEEQQKSLFQAKKDIASYADIYQVARSVVPQEKDQARTVIELVRVAEESGIKLSSIAFPASTLGQATPKPTAPPAEGTKPATPSTPTTTPAPTAPTQLKAVEGIAGVFQLEINIQSDPSKTIQFQTLLDFLERLEQNRRTAQVSNITIQPDTKDRNLVTFSLIINVYVKP